MNKNDRKFNLPGGLTAGGFSLPATNTAGIGGPLMSNPGSNYFPEKKKKF